MLRFLVALPLAFATPALAAEVDPARAELLMQLIRENGCQMTDREAGEILPEHGFEMDETRDIVRHWRKEGKLEMAGALALILSQEACQNG